MPVQIDEIAATVAGQATRSQAAAPVTEAGAAGVRRELRGMGYEAGAARLSPRAAESAAPAAAAPTQIGSGGATVVANGSTVEINAPNVRINAPMTNVSGVLRADTVTANTVAGSTYTPGAGNVW